MSVAPQINYIGEKAILSIPGTKIFSSTGVDKDGNSFSGVTLRKKVAVNFTEAFSSADCLDMEGFESLVKNGRIKEIGKVNSDLSITWDENLFAEAERRVILEARNEFRDENGLPLIDLGDCFLNSAEAIAAGKNSQKSGEK